MLTKLKIKRIQNKNMVVTVNEALAVTLITGIKIAQRVHHTLSHPKASITYNTLKKYL